MVLLRVLDKSLGVVSMIVLARLLTPGDFGLVAMAMSIVALVELLSAFNFDMALIQNQRAGRTEFDSAWTLNVTLGTASGVLLLLGAVPSAAFYGDPRLVWLVVALAAAPLIGGLENIGVVVFRKELDFRREFLFLLVKRLLSFIATLIFAFTLRDYWALVLGTLFGRTAGTLLSYVVHPYRPKFGLGAARKILSFSAWFLANNLLYFLLHRSSDFVVGKALGAPALGVHAISYEIANLPTTNMIAPINRVVYPAYTRVASDRAALGRSFLRVLGLVAMVAIPAGVGIAAISDRLVGLALGARWLEAVPLIEILAIAGAIGAVQTNVGYIYMALGTPRTQTVLAVAYVCLLLPLMLLGVHFFQLRGVALAFLATALLHTPLTFGLVGKDLSIRAKDLVRPMVRPILAAGAMYSVVKSLPPLGAESATVLGVLYLGAAIFLGVLVYGGGVMACWLFAGRPPSAEQEVLTGIAAALRKLRASRRERQGAS